MEEHRLLSDGQFGFRAGRGTEDQLLLMYGKVVKSVDGGGRVDIIYLYYSKAFDLVCHRIMLEKLQSLGFDEKIVGWIENFLVGRIFSLRVDDMVSSVRGVGCGVPQGSMLGPMVFLIYANFIASGTSCEWLTFAYDLKLGMFCE